MKLLEVKNLTISFGEKPVVKDASFYINSGETVALLGASGSGKSVTSLSILGLLQNAKVHGKILLDGRDLLTLSETDLCAIRGRRIGLIFQEPMTSLNPLHRVGRQVGEVLKIHFKKALKSRIIELFKMVGLSPTKMNSFPHQLSGGERQRAMIAMALAGEPDLLIADEPTTALDVSIQKQVLDLLKDLQTKLGLSILFISHDVKIVQYMADRFYKMTDGALSKSERTPVKTSHFAPIKKPSPVVLSVHDLSVSYGDFKALQKVLFDVQMGHTLGIVGESGSGKTTLAQALLRVIDFDGKVILNNITISDLSARQFRPMRAQIGIVFQDPFSSLNPRMSVEQIVEEGLRIHSKLSIQQRRHLVLETLEKVDLSKDILFRYPHELSGGQRQRVALARALILHPSVLILDEPTSALDEATQKSVLDLLRQLQTDLKLTYLFISHDMNVIKQVSDDVLVLKSGCVVEKASVRQIFENPTDPYTQKLIDAAFLS